MPVRVLLILLVGVVLLLGMAPGVPPRTPLAAVTGGSAHGLPTPIFIAPSPRAVPDLDDPFPIRRLPASADQLGELLNKATAGILVRLPRSEFEERVQAASRAIRALPPRILVARYEATLTREGLRGTAIYETEGAGLLPLDPFTPAITKIQNSAGQPVLLFRGANGGLQARIADSTTRSMQMDWSARGLEEPEAERFDLAFPVVGLSRLDLRLPADRIPTVLPAEVLLTGPFPASGGQARWHLEFAGQSRLTVAVRRPGSAGAPPPLLRVHTTARHDLSPGFVDASFNLEFEPLRGRMSEWRLRVDPRLTITDISGSGRLTWRSETPEPGQPPSIRLQAAEPTAVNNVLVRGFLPGPGVEGWTCPTLQVENARPGREQLDLRLSPELTLLHCDPGDFRLINAQADSGYRLTLVGTLPAQETDSPIRRLPTIRVQGMKPDWSSSEEILWRVGWEHQTIEARYRVTINRGPVTTLPLQIPATFQVEDVRLTPDDPGYTAEPDPQNPGQLRIEPFRPLTRGQAVEIVVRFRAPGAREFATLAQQRPEAMLRFPQTMLLNSSDTDGSLIIVPGDDIEAWASAGLGSPSPTGRWSLAYRSRPLDGTLNVYPRPARWTVATETTVRQDPDQIISEHRLTITPRNHQADRLLLMMPPGGEGEWAVRCENGSARPHPLGGFLSEWLWLQRQDPWGWLAAIAHPPSGTLWQISLPRGRPVVITAIQKLPHRPGSLTLSVPRVLNGIASAPEVTLEPSAADRWSVLSPGNERQPIELLPRGETPPRTNQQRWVVTDLSLHSRVLADAAQECTLSGRVLASQGSNMPLTLPPHAELISVVVAGRRDDQARLQEQRLSIMLPVVEDLRFEVRYRLPAEHAASRGPIFALTSPMPELMSGEVPARRWGLDSAFRRWPNLDRPLDIPLSGEELLVIRAPVVQGFGILLAVLILALGIGLLSRRRVRTRDALLPGILTMLFGAASWLAPPGWHPVVIPPALMSLVVVMLFVIRDPNPTRRRAGTVLNESGRLPSTAWHTAGCWLLISLLAPAMAQAPEPVQVHIIEDATNGESVLVAPAVLDRLRSLTETTLPPVILVDAEYDGRTEPGLAHFTAQYSLESTGEGTSWTLPLAGVRLESMELDGRLAFPDGSTGEGYRLPVPPRGRHQLRVLFAVPVKTSGADRQLQFNTPDIPLTRVRFTGPSRTSLPDVTSRRGLQIAPPDGPRVEAEHGSGQTISIRWRDPSTTPTAPPTMTIREACVWDLAEGSSRLLTACLFTAQGQSVNELRVELPEGMEPGPVVVRPADPRSSLEAALREWHIEAGPAGWRTVVLVLQKPLEGTLLALMQLTPSQPLGRQPTLRFPRAVGGNAESYYAIRLDGLTIDDFPRAGVIDYSADVLSKEFAAVPELRLENGLPIRVFQRVAGPVPELKPQLRLTGPSESISGEITWTIGPRASAEGLIQVGRTGVSLVEFDLDPAVEIHDVRAAGLAAWSRNGSRIQVWFKSPTTTAAVRWSGRWDVPRPGSDIPLSLPVPRIREGKVSLRVRGSEGWWVAPEKSTTSTITDDGFALTLPASTASWPVLAFRPVPPDTLTIWERLTQSSENINYQAEWSLTLPTGRPHRFTIRAQGLPAGAAPELIGPVGVTITPIPETPGVWQCMIPADMTGTLSLVLNARLAEPLALPDLALTFDGPPVCPTRRLFSTTIPGYEPADGPTDWHRASREERMALHPPGPPTRTPEAPLWLGRGRGRWVLKVLTPATEIDTMPSPIEPGAGIPNARTLPRGVEPELLPVTGWMLGLLSILFLGLRDPRFRPEQVMGLGLLGAALAGPANVLGLAFILIAASGLLVRVAGWLRSLAPVVFD